MKKILPFKGIVYNQDQLGTLADVVSPPYDVIQSDLQDELYSRSPYNFCRIDLTKEEGDARYRVAHDVFKNWMNQGLLVQDQKPAIYIYHHTFHHPHGSKITRKGFFAARRIEDFSEGHVKPHEKTLDGPKADRLKMTHATHTNLSSVFSLYSDPEHQIQDLFSRLVSSTPFIDFVSHEGERHQLWKLTDPKTLDRIDSLLADRPLFIADGHHRYETALNYRNEMMKEKGALNNRSAVNFLLMYFSNMNDDGLVILPIHRAVHSLKDFSDGDFLEKLSTYFDIKEVQASDRKTNLDALAILGEKAHAFWIFTKDTSYFASMSRTKWLETDLAKSLPFSLVHLDVTVLHQLILGKILGMTEEAQAKQENIIYWKSTEKAIQETSQEKNNLTFILNPTKIEDMETVAMDGQKMPQKSTFFYPKVLSGLVLHSVDTDQLDGVVVQQDF